MPLSNRSINIYQDNIPARPGDNSPGTAAPNAPPATASTPLAAENGNPSGTDSEVTSGGQVEMSSSTVNPFHADSGSITSTTTTTTINGAESRTGRIQSAFHSITSGVANLRSMAYAPSNSSSSSSSSSGNSGTSGTWIPFTSPQYQKISDSSTRGSPFLEEKLSVEDRDLEMDSQDEEVDEERDQRGRVKSEGEQGQKKKVYHI